MKFEGAVQGQLKKCCCKLVGITRHTEMGRLRNYVTMWGPAYIQPKWSRTSVVWHLNEVEPSLYGINDDERNWRIRNYVENVHINWNGLGAMTKGKRPNGVNIACDQIDKVLAKRYGLQHVRLYELTRAVFADALITFNTKCSSCKIIENRIDVKTTNDTKQRKREMEWHVPSRTEKGNGKWSTWKSRRQKCQVILVKTGTVH